VPSAGEQQKDASMNVDGAGLHTLPGWARAAEPVSGLLCSRGHKEVIA